MGKKLVVANWKMHGNLASNKLLLQAYLERLSFLINTDVAVCVPFPYLAQAQSILQNTNIAWGAQNLSKDAVGAYTGEVSAAMLKDFGSSYVIIGHSERATAYCESDENIATKFVQAQMYGLTPILCVGETLIEREAGVMEMVVGKQLDSIINKYGAEVFANSASSDQAQSMHEFIRGKVAMLNNAAATSMKILYGGSVNPQNAVQLFAMQDIDGGLIGKCSLNAQEFEGICRAAAR